jgi:hypothetical protein
LAILLVPSRDLIAGLLKKTTMSRKSPATTTDKRQTAARKRMASPRPVLLVRRLLSLPMRRCGEHAAVGVADREHKCAALATPRAESIRRRALSAG